MFAVIAISGVLAGGVTSLVGRLTGSDNLSIGTVKYVAVGNNVVLLLAAAVAMLLGFTSYRQMDDRPGVPLLDDLAAAVPREVGAVRARCARRRSWSRRAARDRRPRRPGRGRRSRAAAC